MARAIKDGVYLSETEFGSVFNCAIALANAEVCVINEWKHTSTPTVERSQQAYDLEGLVIVLLLLSLPGTQRRQVFQNMSVDDVKTSNGDIYRLHVDAAAEKSATSRYRLAENSMLRWLPVRTDVSACL